MKFNRFTKGTGVYTCGCCGRRTRDTGDGAINGLCSTCYDLAGFENSIMDGYQSELTKNEIQLIIRMVQKVYSNGGQREWDALLNQVVAICEERIAMGEV